MLCLQGLAKASHIPDADTIQILVEHFCKKALQRVLPQDIPRVLSALGTFGELDAVCPGYLT